jgi:hypothetical protein
MFLWVKPTFYFQVKKKGKNPIHMDQTPLFGRFWSPKTNFSFVASEGMSSPLAVVYTTLPCWASDPYDRSGIVCFPPGD